MPRRPRADLPDSGVFHLTVRGVNGCDIVVDERDCFRFTRFLNLATVIGGWRLLASCLMTNHFHLVVMGERELISAGMHRLNFRHAQAFNRRYERRGHLFQDRFHTKVIRNEAHLGHACAYVFDNPVRARLCERRSDWPWIGGELLADLR